LYVLFITARSREYGQSPAFKPNVTLYLNCYIPAETLDKSGAQKTAGGPAEGFFGKNEG
jgi:hypothetical protein